jgi:tripartite-type tricarboxylate transporter receptor subunit TctC
MLARILAQTFEARLNGKFFVENRPGGGGATSALAGYRDLVALPWFALCAPAELPHPTAARLNAVAVETMASPAVARQLEAESIEVLKMNAEQFTAFVQAELDRWGPIAKTIQVKPE